MWDKLREHVAVDQESLHLLIDTFSPLLEETAREGAEPTYIELNALASFLQSFYNGIENILKRISQLVDGRSPRGDSSHADLLRAMAGANAKRSAVISEDLRNRLNEYMRFRHVYRHGYAFRLEWARMAGLALGAEKCLHALDLELAAFLQAGGDAEE